jgi:hypothetical protein
MKALYWLIGGFVLLGLSGMIEAVGDTGASAGARLPIYLAALGALLGASTCFYKALRSAFEMMVGGVDRPATTATAVPGPRPAAPPPRWTTTRQRPLQAETSTPTK